MEVYRLYDDANLPSLISLPYFQFLPYDDSKYLSTRSFLLSTKNPYYFGAGSISGIGSSHTQR